MPGTKVNVVGFSMQFSKNISIGEVYQSIEFLADKEINISGKKIVLYTDIVDGYIAGIVLSYKGDKKSLVTERDESNHLTVNKKTLAIGQHSTEASLFCINAESMRGSVVVYQGGLNVTGFYKVLKKAHDEVKKGKVNDKIRELTKLGDRGMDAKKARKIAEDFFMGDFKLTVLVKELGFDEIIDAASHISRINISVSQAIPDAPFFTPVKDYLSSSAVELRFERDSKFHRASSAINATIRQAFSTIVNDKKFMSMRICGESLTGEHFENSVGDNIEYFGRYDYDRYVELLPDEKWIDYKESPAMGGILDIIKKHAVAVFGLPNKNPASWKIISAKDVNSNSGDAF